MATIKNGIITTDFNGNNDLGQSMVLQPDGKLVVAGSSADASGDSKFALARYNSNGSLDSSFGLGGKITTDVSTYSDYGMSAVIQADGKLVVAGYSQFTQPGSSDLSSFELVRYNTNGSLDTSFGTNGKVITSVGDSARAYSSVGDSVGAYSIAIQPNGKLIAAGYSPGINGASFTLVRYNTNGSLDATFDFDGKVTTDIGSNHNSCANSVVIQPDGKLVAVGYSDGFNIVNDKVYSNFSLARYNVNGSLDTTFNGVGKVINDFGFGDSYARSVVIQPDGKLVAAGYSTNTQGKTDFALVRYKANGSLDTTFHGDGKVTTDFGFGDDDEATSVVIQPDGKLVVAGYSKNAQGNLDFALARYNTNGSLDTTFHGDGKVTTDFGFGYDEGATSVAIQPDGKLVVTGGSKNAQGNYDFAIVRYNPDGSLDTTFNGVSTSPIPTTGKTITGTANNDMLIGTVGNDLIMGLAGNDTLKGIDGNDTLDGGAGTDTASYNGQRSNFDVTKTTTGYTVADKTGAEGTDTLTNIEKITFADMTISLEGTQTPTLPAGVTYTPSGNAGQAFRIYKAAFDRMPDKSGLDYWINKLNTGSSLTEVAGGFMQSTEFIAMYGTNPTAEDFVTKVYNNVLHRAPEISGYTYWAGVIHSGVSQPAVLASISESAENQAAVLQLVGVSNTTQF